MMINKIISSTRQFSSNNYLQKLLFENLALNLHYARAGILGKSSVCINLIFTTKESLVINSGFYAASIPNITDKIICGKFNLINNLII